MKKHLLIEHVRNFSDIFQSINNITMVVIGIYTLTQIIQCFITRNFDMFYTVKGF
jgi:hypothetical protein